MTFQKPTDHGADRVDAGLVVATAVDIGHFTQQRDQGVLLESQLGGDFGFGHLASPPSRWCGRVY
jgi:hypothetical protein